MRRPAAWICWSFAALAAFLSGWTGADGAVSGEIAGQSAQWISAVSLTIGAGLILTGGLFQACGAGAGGGWRIRILPVPLAAFFIGLGLGGLLHALIHDGPARSESLIALYGAALCLLVAEGLHRRQRRIDLMLHEVIRDGIRTEGRIVQLSRFRVNEEPMSRVTVRFTGQDGRQHCASDTISGHAVLGQKVDIRYLPSRLNLRRGVVIARRY